VAPAVAPSGERGKGRRRIGKERGVPCNLPIRRKKRGRGRRKKKKKKDRGLVIKEKDKGRGRNRGGGGLGEKRPSSLYVPPQ